jgi:Family of unknown function (DUF6505)
VRLLRTIRLDPSDTFLFKKAAEPGEWAVSGAFAFAHVDPAALDSKARAAFRTGFLGISSLGWSTLAHIVEATREDRIAAIETLARRLVERFGAPDLATARSAAEEEIDFAASLCDRPSGRLVAVSRNYESGEIRETFRALRRSADAPPIRAISFSEIADEDEALPDHIDLVVLAKRGQR